MFYRDRLFDWLRKRAPLLLVAIAGGTVARAQDGNQGISQANTMIRGYYDTGCQLMYAIGAVLALVGAVQVFRHWNAGHQQEAYKAAAGWFGSCVFLVIVATVIKSFFGL
ncbi:MAG TPA: DUF4134 domain-containing protein [Puia sp.]|uniref:DUF4134 domain-containing protein n=1 Tax=Puia sp. TaxID=2045100 RepID=UPI002D139EC9|nr:DUF4134 domain-containing protein [Puia sp.]HVU95488.1 DUF4134 domain-containing protein [Puia sp.]